MNKACRGLRYDALCRAAEQFELTCLHPLGLNARPFSWSAAIFGLLLDSRWLKSALLLGNVRAGVD